MLTLSVWQLYTGITGVALVSLGFNLTPQLILSYINRHWKKDRTRTDRMTTIGVTLMLSGAVMYMWSLAFLVFSGSAGWWFSVMLAAGGFALWCFRLWALRLGKQREARS